MILDAFSIVTLIFFLLSSFFVAVPVSIPLPFQRGLKISLGLTSAPTLAVLILWASQCLGGREIKEGVIGAEESLKPYTVVVLSLSLSYLSNSLNATGGLTAAASWIRLKGGGDRRKLGVSFCLVRNLVSAVLGNDPLILSNITFIPALGEKQRAWLLLEAVATNTASMLFFIANPTNIILCELFGIKYASLTTHTIVPFLACSIVCYFALYLLHSRSAGTVHPTSDVGTNSIPDEGRPDHFNSAVGALWLGACITAATILNAFHFEVWMVVLGFAGAKLLFDIYRDHGRKARRQIPAPEDGDMRSVEGSRQSDTESLSRSSQRRRNATIRMFVEALERSSETTDSRDTTPPSSERTRSQDDRIESRGATTPPVSSENIPQVHVWLPSRLSSPRSRKLLSRFPTTSIAVRRLPYSLILFTFAQFILIGGLEHRGWIDTFAQWLNVATNGSTIPVVWLLGTLGAILSNVEGTNIGVSIFLAKITLSADLSEGAKKAAAVSLMVACNLGRVNYVSSSRLARRSPLRPLIAMFNGRSEVEVYQRMGAIWDLIPLFLMAGAGLGIVTAFHHPRSRPSPTTPTIPEPPPNQPTGAITPSAIATLALFVLSSIFVAFPVSIPVRLGSLGRWRIKIGLLSAPTMAILILWAAQCLGATQIRNGIVGTDGIKPYNILILFISLAYMAITLDVTGVLQAAAFWVSNKGGKSGRKLYFYFYLLLLVISMIVGNDPVILSGTVFLVYYTAATGLEPEPWLISEFAAANTASMVLFVGNPTNVVICEGFRINNAAFTAYTILPFIACGIACYLALMLQYRSEKHVPRTLNVTGNLNPREVLRDPVSAIFGSIWLAVCLVVVIVLSFIHVDVWKIVLPFAGGKFVFDIAWDHYRYTTGKIPKFDEGNRNEDLEAPLDDPMAIAFRRAMSNGIPLSNSTRPFSKTSRRYSDASDSLPSRGSLISSRGTLTKSQLPRAASPSAWPLQPLHHTWIRAHLDHIRRKFAAHFPTVLSAFPRLPFGLIPFALSQFILVEALQHQGWIELFSRWLVIATHGQTIPLVWIVGVVGIALCNVAGTSIGATILLTKIIRASDFPDHPVRAAAISLAVVSNIGAVSFNRSASMAGMLWTAILMDKGIRVGPLKFAWWNLLPLVAMTGVGLGVVTGIFSVLQ